MRPITIVIASVIRNHDSVAVMARGNNRTAGSNGVDFWPLARNRPFT